MLVFWRQDRTLRRQELDAIRQQSEREVAERLHLEDAILEKTMATLTLDKAADYSKKILQKLREDERRRVGLGSLHMQLFCRD